MNPALALGLVLLLTIAPAGANAGKSPVPTDNEGLGLAGLPPAPDLTLYFREFPSCTDCRVAMAYLVQSREIQCQRPLTGNERMAFAQGVTFDNMLSFVKSVEKNESKGRYSNLKMGDRRRALTLKAKLLLDEQPCR